MSDGILNSTLREVRATLSAPLTPVIMLVVALILGISGPFGTYAELSLGGRLGYWGAIVVATFVAGDFIGTLVGTALPRAWPRVARVPIIGIAAGTAVFGVVTAINWLSFGSADINMGGGATLYLYCVVIATGIVAIFSAHGLAEARRPATAQADAARVPALMKRVPVQVRGDLVRMSMQDHYVEVETVKGTTLVLMRMADAIAETEGAQGLQIHRSHWVALDQVQSVRRTNGKVLVTLKSGTELPVSRTFMPAARAAGLIT